MVKYTLINPVLIGTMKHSFTTETPENAAKEFWDAFTSSKIITNNIPQFGFTLQGSKKDIYHFIVNEDVEGNYTIKHIDVKVPKKEINKFLHASSKVKSRVLKSQEGGKHKKRYKDDDSSSSSDSSSDEEDYLTRIRIRNSPLSYFWYAPGIYRNHIRRIFTPTFNAVYPYNEIWFPGDVWIPV
jgi:hypothetical protein